MIRQNYTAGNITTGTRFINLAKLKSSTKTLGLPKGGRMAPLWIEAKLGYSSGRCAVPSQTRRTAIISLGTG
jgi:hypothetical protein